MPISDFLYILRFWFVYLVLGLVAFPITSRIFSRFIDRGWIFSKIIGILLVSFLMWFLASFKVLPFNYVSLLLIVSLISLLSLITLIFSRFNRETHNSASLQEEKINRVTHHDESLRKKLGNILAMKQWNNGTIFLISFEELMFLGCLLLWSYVRGFQPVIEGLEKYMDFGFINAILKSQYFPPHDMWMSGYTINYYYFGHLVAAVLTLFSKIPAEVIYNLMIAVTFAFCFTASFSLGLNIFYHLLKTYRPLISKISLITLIFPALLTAYLVTNAANLQPIYHLLTKGSSTYWYPDATRFIVKKFGATDETIHEFPHYSFVVADLHGHVSDIPNVLLLIGFTFVLFLKIDASRHPEERSDEGSPRDAGSRDTWGPFSASRRIRVIMSALPLSVFDSLFLGFLLSSAYMTNAMDGPVYFALAGLVVFGTYIFVGVEHVQPLQVTIKQALLKSSLFFFFTGLTFIICSFPFFMNFKNFTGGPTLVDFHTPFWMLGVLWGFQFFMFFSFLIFLFGRKIFKRENLAKMFANFFGVQVKIINPEKSENSTFHAPDLFIIFLGIMAAFLIIFPEFFYIKDIYIHEYQRANTMFKMTYQAFILFYILTPYVFFRILLHMKSNKNNFLLFPSLLFLTLASFGIFSVSIYPYFAVKSYYGLVNYQSLDGLKYLKDLYPDNYQLIKYLSLENNFTKTNLMSKNPQLFRPVGEFDSKQTNWPKPKSENRVPIILEAVGDSYTKYANISANTGFPTVLGWPVHEWLWRNSYKADGTSIGYDLPGKRTAEVQLIYESKNLEETKVLLKKYFVDFVWVGKLEREKYKNLAEGKFGKIGKAFLKFGDSTLYRVD